MPPKPADKKASKAKISYALEFHVDLDLKKLLDNIARASTKTQMDSVKVFQNRLRSELQSIKDGEQLDVPLHLPLFLTETIPFDSLKHLLICLEPYPWLKKVSLWHCKIQDDGAMLIADYLKKYKPAADKNPFGIEVLELPENDIGPRGAGYLGRVLTQNETVKIVNLDFNPLGDDGAAVLGDGLKWNSTVEKLSLKYCDIGKMGGECIGKYVVRSSSVKELYLRGNCLGPHGVTQLARSLAKNAYLTKLDLADNSFGIDLEAIEALRDGIESNDSLTSVDLNLNSMVPAGTQILLEMLKSKPKLVQFEIYERVSDDVFRDVLETVQVNMKLMSKKKKKGGKKSS